MSEEIYKIHAFLVKYTCRVCGLDFFIGLGDLGEILKSKKLQCAACQGDVVRVGHAELVF